MILQEFHYDYTLGVYIRVDRNVCMSQQNVNVFLKLYSSLYYAVFMYT